MECNATEIWCDSGYYNDNQCWYGNYCLQQVNEWDGCPGMCHQPCNWDTEEFCDMGMDSNNCWLGNYCQDFASGGCPAMTGSGSNDYGSSGSGSGSCFEPYTMECNATEIHCDAGMDSEGCWYGNYCINQVNEWDGCHGMCPMNCNWETEDWCDMGTDSAGCWFGNYCIDSVNSWDSCPGMCSTNCNWDTEEWCDMGTDSNGCWMGNWCQPMEQGGCPDVNMVSKRGAMEKKKAMALQSDRQFFGSDYSSSYGSDSGSDYGFNYGSGSD